MAQTSFSSIVFPPARAHFPNKQTRVYDMSSYVNGAHELNIVHATPMFTFILAYLFVLSTNKQQPHPSLSKLFHPFILSSSFLHLPVSCPSFFSFFSFFFSSVLLPLFTSDHPWLLSLEVLGIGTRDKARLVPSARKSSPPVCYGQLATA